LNREQQDVQQLAFFGRNVDRWEVLGGVAVRGFLRESGLQRPNSSVT